MKKIVVQDKFAIVDDDDFERLNQFHWILSHGYAYCVKVVKGKRTAYRMHRVVLGLVQGDPRQVDHKNRNRLDNRKRNLRIFQFNGPQNQNTSARPFTSKYRGVFWDKRRGKWRSEVKFNGKVFYLGRFDFEYEAARIASNFRKELMPFTIEPVWAAGNKSKTKITTVQELKPVGYGKVKNPKILNSNKTHCPKNHPYDKENTYQYNGVRRCKICSRQQAKNTYYKNKARTTV